MSSSVPWNQNTYPTTRPQNVSKSIRQLESTGCSSSFTVTWPTRWPYGFRRWEPSSWTSSQDLIQGLQSWCDTYAALTLVCLMKKGLRNILDHLQSNECFGCLSFNRYWVGSVIFGKYDDSCFFKVVDYGQNMDIHNYMQATGSTR